MARSNPPPEPARAANPSGIDWGAALTEHGPWLRKVILARVGEQAAVDEVFQEVALAAVSQRAPLADATKVAPWLYRLAVIQSLLYRRRRGRQRKLVDRFAQTGLAENSDRTADPLDWLLADERRDTIHEALRRLGPRDAEILVLKYTQDWSYHQIAERLGISHSAVETRLHRARARLRSQLAETTTAVSTS
ncbi:MAG: sigma-70 family RNA polymerase sigma factor [Pirellulales bacterium]|nr:sigma-70 family RNA polymerase sigma factor [Pirellulales bacterium]